MGPLEPLVRFAAATNLQLAGAAVRVEPGFPHAERLRAALTGLGAREAEPADVVFALGGPVAPPAIVVTPDAVLGAPAPDAASRIDFARARMPISAALAADLDLAGHRVGISLVLEPKTAVLALLLAEAGAEVHVFAFAIETDDAVAAELAARGVRVHASAAATPAEERAAALALLDAGPDLLIDDGGHLIRLAHAERPGVVDGLIGASEETTSGLAPLRAMAADGRLRIPVVAANDARSKTFFDNRHGTGESCVLALLGVLGAGDLDGRTAVVIGFGPVGQGTAQVLRAVGADVVVVELDPVRALAARYDGYRTAALHGALPSADVVVSATGVPHTLDLAALRACRAGAVVAVAGGVPEEVSLAEAARAGAVRTPIGRDLESLALPGGTAVRLAAGGECVNIVAGHGNPVGIMDLSFGVQLGAVRQLLQRRLLAGVHPIDPAADAAVAALASGLPAPDAAPAPPVPDWRRTRFDLA